MTPEIKAPSLKTAENEMQQGNLADDTSGDRPEPNSDERKPVSTVAELETYEIICPLAEAVIGVGSLWAVHFHAASGSPGFAVIFAAVAAVAFCAAAAMLTTSFIFRWTE